MSAIDFDRLETYVFNTNTPSTGRRGALTVMKFYRALDKKDGLIKTIFAALYYKWDDREVFRTVGGARVWTGHSVTVGDDTLSIEEANAALDTDAPCVQLFANLHPDRDLKIDFDLLEACVLDVDPQAKIEHLDMPAKMQTLFEKVFSICKVFRSRNNYVFKTDPARSLTDDMTGASSSSSASAASSSSSSSSSASASSTDASAAPAAASDSSTRRAAVESQEVNPRPAKQQKK